MFRNQNFKSQIPNKFQAPISSDKTPFFRTLDFIIRIYLLFGASPHVGQVYQIHFQDTKSIKSSLELLSRFSSIPSDHKERCFSK
jgi:hypothetical protein